DLFHDLLEHFAQFVRRAADAQADESETRPLVEDDDENHSLGNNRDVDVVVLAFVREYWELFLPDQPRQAVRRSYVPGRQARKTRRIDLSDLPVTGDLLAILVDKEDQLGVRIDAQSGDDRLYELVLL